jgi:uncharacterized repeat protein (TIGR03803 family)
VFDHIVIIFQENRTPDNLFASAANITSSCGGQDDFEPGVDIQNWGANKNDTQNNGKTCFTPHPLGPDPVNPGHFHGNFTDTWDSGHMDNACPKSTNFDCYAYVQHSDVQPYFDIATNYGFDRAGNLYGTASGGGDPNCSCGVVFKMTPGAKGKWNYTVLHRFKGTDGWSPEASLVVDGKGNIYGTTVAGGAGSAGVVFEITP